MGPRGTRLIESQVCAWGDSRKRRLRNPSRPTLEHGIARELDSCLDIVRLKDAILRRILGSHSGRGTEPAIEASNPMFGISEVGRDEHRNGDSAPFFFPGNDSEEESQWTAPNTLAKSITTSLFVIPRQFGLFVSRRILRRFFR